MAKKVLGFWTKDSSSFHRQKNCFSLCMSKIFLSFLFSGYASWNNCFFSKLHKEKKTFLLFPLRQRGVRAAIVPKQTFNECSRNSKMTWFSIDMFLFFDEILHNFEDVQSWLYIWCLCWGRCNADGKLSSLQRATRFLNI